MQFVSGVSYTEQAISWRGRRSTKSAADGARVWSGARKQEKVIHALFISTVAAYALSLALYLFFLNTGKVLTGRLGTLLLAAGLVTHYFALLERSRGLHTVPYHDLYGAMSLFGWLLALTYLGLELYHRQRSVGALVLPFILVFFVAAHLAPADKLSPPDAHGPTFAFHVALNILAYAAFALSCVLIFTFLIEERVLRSHKLGDVVWRLPPLELLERMSRSSVLIGLVCITIGTAFGFLWVYRLSDKYSFYDPKYAITLLVLILYAVYFRLARTTAWRGARASKLCVFNFLILFLSFTVVNLYLSANHRFF
jgi:ABC-type uncharacterized transport system permease subunit